jgi:hypothetical protein
MSLMEVLALLHLAALGAVHVEVVGLVIEGALLCIRRVLHGYLTVQLAISSEVHTHLQFLHAGRGRMSQMDGTGRGKEMKGSNRTKITKIK